jgi:Fe(3+) dicitrate transport protein
MPSSFASAVHRSLSFSMLLLLAMSPSLDAQASSEGLPPFSGAPLDESVARISGAVFSDAGVPLPGVSVEVIRGESSAHTETDRRGRFSLVAPVADGSVIDLRFMRMGFGTEERSITVTAGSTDRLEIRLTREPVPLDPVQVLLERTRMIGDPVTGSGIPGSASHVGRADLRASSMAFANIHDILRQVPGVNVQGEDGYGLRPNIGLRGAGAERSSNVTLMEDGVLIAPAPYSAPAAYHFPVAGRMDAVEVRKGASQVRYGPRTLGGAVNLVSAGIPDRRSWMADLSGGGDRMFRGHVRVGDSSERFGWLLEGYRIGTDGFKELDGGGDTGFDTRDAQVRFRINSSPESARHQEVELKLAWNEHESDETYLGLTEEDFRRTPRLRYAASQEDVMDTEHTQIQLRYFVRPSVASDLVVTAYRNDFDRIWYKLQSVAGAGISGIVANPEAFTSELAWIQGADSPDDAFRIRANNRTYRSEGVQAAFGYSIEGSRAHHGLEFGARIHRDDEDRLQWEDGFRMDNGRMVLTSEGAPGSQANRLSDARAVALYVQDEIRSGRWTFTPGVRWETIDFTRTTWAGQDPGRTGSAETAENSVNALIPGVGISWEWSPRTHLFGGLHRGFGPPGPGADQETRVEESLNWEAGIRMRRAGVGADVTAYFTDYSNVLGRETLATGGPGSGDLFNGGEVEVYGLEAAADLDVDRYLPLPVRVPVRASWTLTRGTFQSSFESGYGPWGSVEAGDRLPYQPEHTWSGSIGVEDQGRSMTLSWNGASAMRTEAGRGPIADGTGADGFTVLSLRGEWALTNGGTVYGGIQNLADAEYVLSRRPAGARPGLPRTLFAGFRVSR